MTDQISWRVLTTEMVESTRQEAGVVNYERFVSADGNFVHVYARSQVKYSGSATMKTASRDQGYARSPREAR